VRLRAIADSGGPSVADPNVCVITAGICHLTKLHTADRRASQATLWRVLGARYHCGANAADCVCTGHNACTLKRTVSGKYRVEPIQQGAARIYTEFTATWAGGIKP
jgi:hypothetical protein